MNDEEMMDKPFVSKKREIRISLGNLVIAIGVILLICGVALFSYDQGLRTGANQGVNYGINYGANAVAQQMCVNESTFNCPDSNKICGCFSIAEKTGDQE